MEHCDPRAAIRRPRADAGAHGDRFSRLAILLQQRHEVHRDRPIVAAFLGPPRAAFRDQHLERAWAASASGALVLGGALGDPVDGALLLFLGDSPAVAEAFAKTDPYVTNGLVKRWHVRQWNTVAGASAANAARPAIKRSASSSW